MNARPAISDLGLSAGKKARLFGLAGKFFRDFAGEVPLILRLNGKTEVPSDAEALSPVTATVADAVRLGMPLVVWAYPRGSAIEAKGGRDSFYTVDYAARTASELGAGLVKVNFPHPGKRAGDDTMLEKARQSAEAGVTGLIFGTGARRHRSFGGNMSLPS